jgi:hypothetical protein
MKKKLVREANMLLNPLEEVKKSKNFKKYSLEAREKIKLAVKLHKVVKQLEKIINEL